MINNEILSFIKEQIAQGTTKDQIKNMLVTQGGWDENDVVEAFDANSISGTSYPSVLKNAMAQAEKEEVKPLVFQPKPAFAQPVVQSQSSLTPSSFQGMTGRQAPMSMEPSVPPSEPHVVVTTALASNVPQTVTSESSSGGMVANSDPMAGLRARLGAGLPGINQPVSTEAFPKAMSQNTTTPFAPPLTNMRQTVHNEPITSTLPKPILTPEVSPIVTNIGYQSSFSPLPTIEKKTLEPLTPAPQPATIFPKGQGSFITPYSPRGAAVIQPIQKRGGRFLLGLMMFLVGIVVGGIAMHTYLYGTMNSILEKGMGIIGLGNAPTEIQPIIPTAPVK